MISDRTDLTLPVSLPWEGECPDPALPPSCPLLGGRPWPWHIRCLLVGGGSTCPGMGLRPPSPPHADLIDGTPAARPARRGGPDPFLTPSVPQHLRLPLFLPRTSRVDRLGKSPSLTWSFCTEGRGPVSSDHPNPE